MQHEQGTWPGAGGLAIAFDLMFPSDRAPRAIVVLSHGVAEHAGRYRHLAEALVARGFGFVGHDHRGHGRSAGTRVFVERFAEYAEDLEMAVRRAKERFPGVPVFVFGHSMGGLIAIDHLLRYPDAVSGAVLSGPGVEVGVKVPAWKDTLARVMSKLWPKLAVPTGIPAADISRDPATVKAYESDPLVTKKATARWYTEFLDTQARAFALASSIHTPLLVIWGGRDRLVNPNGIARWFESVGSADRTAIPYPELFHEVINEPERGVVIGDIIRWLEARVPN
jgi:alpha-beta hydrolase superfamily lysophospholipase